MNHHKPKILRFKVENSVKYAVYKFLWMLPYCPYLQPIELYWSAGNEKKSGNYYFSRSTKSIVSDLRDGWYGNTYCTTSGGKREYVPSYL